MKKEKNTKSYVLMIVYILLFLALSTSAAYSFIAAKIIGNDKNGEIKVKSAQVYALFEGNDLVAKDILPGYSDTLEFQITNTSETENTYGNYSIIWNIEKNEINTNDFVYNVTCKTYKNGKEVTEDIPYNKTITVNDTRIPEMSTVIGVGMINTGVTHKCKLNILLKETGKTQNELKNKLFTSSLVAKGEPVVE